MRDEVRLECERVLREVEERIERFMAIHDGEEPLVVSDGVQSVLLGAFAGKGVSIDIYVQPGMDDEFWRT